MSIYGVAQIGAQSASSTAYFLMLLAFVNISIGMLNLVPLLPLDGGPRRDRHLRAHPLRCGVDAT